MGRHFLRYAADSNLKRVYLELGGKSPNIILPDAPDLDAAADTAAWAIFFNSGEMCTAGSRAGRARATSPSRSSQRIVETGGAVVPGRPVAAGHQDGAAGGPAPLDRVLGAAAAAGSVQGATLRTGGQQVLADTGGAYLEPTVVTGAAPDNVLVRDEIFGPVLTVQTVGDEAEAVRVAGDTPYGLAAAVWTRDLGKAHRISRALRAGTVWVNCYEEGDMNVPFGGVKLSGFGRDKSRHALDGVHRPEDDLDQLWLIHAHGGR